MLFIIPAIAIMFIAILNYRKGFMLYLLLQMVWFPDTQIVNIGGSWVNINFICALFFSILFFIKKKRMYKEKMPFPFYVPMLFITLSLLLTCFTSYSGPISELMKAFGLIIMNLFIVYIIWRMINKKKDFEFLFKWLTIIVLVACVYIFYERVTNLNPVLDYKISCTTNTFSTYRDTQQWDYRGYRCYSIFDHTICACMIYALYVALTLNLYFKCGKYPFKMISLVTSIMCIPAMFFTQQRSGMVLLFISVLPVVNFKSLKFWKLMFISFCSTLAIYPFISDNVNLLLSIFSSKAADQVSGSSALMRFDQLDAVFRVMLNSPLTGLGENFQSFYEGVYAERAMGYESLWFEQMAKHGLFGVFAYIIMIYYSIYIIPKKYKSKQVFYISLAYWITYTMTSTPYFRTYFLYTVIFYFIKNSKVYSYKLKNICIENKNNLMR